MAGPLHRIPYLSQCIDGCGTPNVEYRPIAMGVGTLPPEDTNRRYWRCAKCTARRYVAYHPQQAGVLGMTAKRSPMNHGAFKPLEDRRCRCGADFRRHVLKEPQTPDERSPWEVCFECAAERYQRERVQLLRKAATGRPN